LTQCVSDIWSTIHAYDGWVCSIEVYASRWEFLDKVRESFSSEVWTCHVGPESLHSELLVLQLPKLHVSVNCNLHVFLKSWVCFRLIPCAKALDVLFSFKSIMIIIIASTYSKVMYDEHWAFSSQVLPVLLSPGFLILFLYGPRPLSCRLLYIYFPFIKPNGVFSVHTCETILVLWTLFYWSIIRALRKM